MAPEKGIGYMPKNEKKRLASEKKRQDKAMSTQEAREKEQEKKTETRKDETIIVINLKAGRGGGHNCPSKDAAKTHAFTQRCLAKGHAGACRFCKHLASGKDGCSDCQQKPKDLQYSKIRFSFD